ncbi:PDR/VanB family oxidoreductase [Bradyrhizobium sp. LHD-71]|uniref:PDR/VanB family oxidoreductase n=1 Tax=Bradyrhizobium sp. LHD-71 TaxID=3072141 RepID=UPI00280CE0B7|nr:PDR/VanB family oxidoreductase [Bradyrhizobium sp. LHD-71]MDQ8727109.1 PDR/VanB family oxidoreductase [Bradyrhizobium sp. LHD-71]
MAETSVQVFVKQITFETDRINSYTLHAVDGDHLPAFTAGAHIDLHLAEGSVRSYSLINDPSERHRYVIAVKREEAGRGGSAHIHDNLKAGEALTLCGPRNNFCFDEGDHPSIFIAGGIGITPILSMIRRAVTLGRRWFIHYASRTRRDAAFLDEIDTLVRSSHGKVNIVFDQEAGGGALDIQAIVSNATEGAHLYCCGPLPMLDTFKQVASNRQPHTVHLEYFSPKEEAATTGGFDVQLRRSGRTVTVLPGQTILHALLDAGVNVPYACGEGTCGTCETQVIQGIPDHRDVYLTDEERAANKQIMICCSGSQTPLLILDL